MQQHKFLLDALDIAMTVKELSAAVVVRIITALANTKARSDIKVMHNATYRHRPPKLGPKYGSLPESEQPLLYY